MELQHKFTVPAPVDETWAMFNDLEQVAPCFPGAALTSADGDDFAGTVKVKLGPVSLQYSGSGSFLERDEANHTARFEAKGKDKRGNGTASATVKAVLAPDGSGTAVEVSTDLAVTGKPAQFGRGLMQDVSDKLLAKFVDCLTDKLTTGEGETAGTSQSGSAETTEQLGHGSGAATAPGRSPAGSGESMAEPASSSSTEQLGHGSGAATSGGPSPAGTPASGSAQSSSDGSPSGASPTTPPRPRAASREQAPAAELDLGATVLPVLAKRYGPAALGVLLVLLVLRKMLRR